jgi:hypothetical protein
MSTMKQTSQAPTQSNILAFAGRGDLAYLLMLIGAAVLAITGLGSLLVFKAITGWVLMLHVGCAPVFAVGLAWVSLTWTGHTCACAEHSLLHRAARPLLWLVLASGLVVILSGVLPMTPLCGTDGQRTLVSVHLYSAILLTAALALHVLNVVAAKRR